MTAKWIGKKTGTVLAALGVALACGPGRAIFVVDVYSFMNASADTVHYTVPIVTTDSIRNTPMKVNLLGGLGKSDVDTVTITAGDSIYNATGTGTIAFQIFFASDSTATYAGTPLLSVNGAAGPGATATSSLNQAVIVGDSLFKQQTLWVGVQARVQATAAPLDGKIKLTALTLRIVLKDKIF
jgi:hypothetical protein